MHKAGWNFKIDEIPVKLREKYSALEELSDSHPSPKSLMLYALKANDTKAAEEIAGDHPSIFEEFSEDPTFMKKSRKTLQLPVS